MDTPPELDDLMYRLEKRLFHGLADPAATPGLPELLDDVRALPLDDPRAVMRQYPGLVARLQAVHDRWDAETQAYLDRIGTAPPASIDSPPRDSETDGPLTARSAGRLLAARRAGGRP